MEYKEWLSLRLDNKDEHNQKLCYCGHTKMCDCVDPDEVLFNTAVSRGTIIEGDKDNGWKSTH